MVQSTFAHRALALFAAALLLGISGSPGLAAGEKAKKPATATAQPTKTARFIPGSQETRYERSARLKRECKGRVNAGACEGYTQ